MSLVSSASSHWLLEQWLQILRWMILSVAVDWQMILSSSPSFIFLFIFFFTSQLLSWFKNILSLVSSVPFFESFMHRPRGTGTPLLLPLLLFFSCCLYFFSSFGFVSSFLLPKICMMLWGSDEVYPRHKVYLRLNWMPLRMATCKPVYNSCFCSHLWYGQSRRRKRR